MEEKKEAVYNVLPAGKEDVKDWMKLVEIVKDDFPGLNKKEYEKVLLENIENKTALCAKSKDRITGILLFSLKENILSFLAVDPEYRGMGIASALIESMINYFPKNSNICVTTYREGDAKGEAARILYKKCGFIEGELIEEFNYPCQKFILHVL
jgi:ribosomal protein S18 acetylase RimI-like enzyme